MSQEAGLAGFPDWDMQMMRATDPRASGLMAVSVNSNLVEVGEGVVLTKAMNERLTNEGGPGRAPVGSSCLMPRTAP